MKWVNFNVLEPFKSEFHVPVFMENDVRAATLGEYKFGAGRGYNNFACITIGTGIGSGIVLDGRLYPGPTEVAGEIGHMIVIPDGDPCLCGSRGCLEAYASAYGMIRLVKKYISDGKQTILVEMVNGDINKITPKDIVAAYHENDAAAKEILGQMFKLLSIAISNYINLFNFELVIIGGGVANMGDILINKIRDFAVFPVIPKPAHDIIEIKKAELGEEAGMFGTIALVMEKMK